MLHAKEKQFQRDARQLDLDQRLPQVPLVPSGLLEPRVPVSRPPIPSLLSLPNRLPRFHSHHRQSEHHLRLDGRPQRFFGPGSVMQHPVVMHQGPVPCGKRFPPPFVPRGVGQSLLGPPPVRAPLRNTAVGIVPGCQPHPHRRSLNKEGSVCASPRKRDSGHVATGKNNRYMSKSKTDAKTAQSENELEMCVEGTQMLLTEQTEPAVKKLKNLGVDELVDEAESGSAEQKTTDTDSPVIPEPQEEESLCAEAEEDLALDMTAEVQGVGTSLKVTIQRSSESRAFSTGPEDTATAAAAGQTSDKDKNTTAGKICCHICNVTCSDQQEFQTHMISSDHQQKMMEIQRLSNTCLATLLPQMQQNLQGPQREKRQGLPRWCAICQSHFTGDLIEHRRTKKHKVAKVSSRPFCTVCERYFRTPRKFVEHMKSPEHKQQVEELREGGPEVMEELITVDAIGCFEGEDDYEEEENEDKEEDSLETVFPELMNACGGYDPDTQYGASFVVPAAGFLCKLCHKFYHFESSAREIHCKSLMHYQNLQKYKAMLSLPTEDEENLPSSKTITPNSENSRDAASGTTDSASGTSDSASGMGAEHEQEEKYQSLTEHLTSCHDSTTPEQLPEHVTTHSPAGTTRCQTRKAGRPTRRKKKTSGKSLNT